MVTQATRFASHYIAPLALPEVCMADLDPGYAAAATPGAVWFAEAQRAEYERRPSAWPRYNLNVVLHEVLHQYGWRAGAFTNPSAVAFDEGLVSAVVVDLFPRWSKMVLGWRVDTRVPGVYQQSASTVRSIARTPAARRRLLASSYRGTP